jgi:hypothetical protein
LLFFASLLLGPFGKLIGYGVGIMAVLAILFGLWKMHDAEIKHEALLEFNAAQLKQTIADQAIFQKQLADLKTKGDQLESANADLAKKIDEKTANVQTWLGSQIDTNKLDPIFNRTLKKLRGIVK